MWKRDELEANLKPTKTRLQTSKMVQVTVRKEETCANRLPLENQQRDFRQIRWKTVLQFTGNSLSLVRKLKSNVHMSHSPDLRYEKVYSLSNTYLGVSRVYMFDVCAVVCVSWELT